MTKEELKEIYYINQEIKMWQKELGRLQCKSLIKGQEITDMPRGGGGSSDKIADMAVEMADIEAIIKGKLAEIQMQRKKILDYINSIEDSFMRQIIFLRNVSCLTWNGIACEMGGDSTANGMRMAYNRFFKKEEKAK